MMCISTECNWSSLSLSQLEFDHALRLQPLQSEHSVLCVLCVPCFGIYLCAAVLEGHTALTLE